MKILRILFLLIPVVILISITAINRKDEKIRPAVVESSKASSVLRTPEPRADLRVASEPREKDPVASGLDSNQDPSKRTPQERTAGITRGMHYMYDKAVAGLHLDPTEEEKLWAYLIAREEAGAIAHDVVAELRTGKPEEFGIMAERSRREVDEEMKTSFNEATYAKIKAMIDASNYIGALNLKLDPAFTAAGNPLTPEQFMSLASAMYQSFGGPDGLSSRPLAQNIDPITVLTKQDADTLERASRFLTPQQIVILKQYLVSRNERMLGILPSPSVL
jgi:hypothetical protein